MFEFLTRLAAPMLQEAPSVSSENGSQGCESFQTAPAENACEIYAKTTLTECGACL